MIESAQCNKMESTTHSTYGLGYFSHQGVKFGLGLQPLHHCCLGCVDIEVGYRFMCLIFLGYGVIGFLVACVNLGGGEDVWKDFGEYNSKGLAWSRLLLHTCFTALQFVGLKAHWNRDARKADYYFWGWMTYAAASFYTEINHIASIGSDTALFEKGQCDRCMSVFKDAKDCLDPKIVACIRYDTGSFRGWAYFVGILSLMINTGINLYFAMVARSYWYHLHDDKMIHLGHSVNDTESLTALTPMEQQALGGDANVYVKMEDGPQR